MMIQAGAGRRAGKNWISRTGIKKVQQLVDWIYWWRRQWPGPTLLRPERWRGPRCQGFINASSKQVIKASIVGKG